MLQNNAGKPVSVHHTAFQSALHHTNPVISLQRTFLRLRRHWRHPVFVRVMSVFLGLAGAGSYMMTEGCQAGRVMVQECDRWPESS